MSAAICQVSESLDSLADIFESFTPQLALLFKVFAVGVVVGVALGPLIDQCAAWRGRLRPAVPRVGLTLRSA